ncbi:DUF3293 domain-containing protein [Arenimonas composti]|uniref:Tyrosine specific protein phosphatases domain-containing protein n=1 Tax=Arenimonas composti TR7-09 = DSM 18010 TaxID=1121013 RepID=A0A091BWV6_9GAMM|nr:DUF3293 domain-containing protein [Arenimonas composti]KFN48825.1 hypothetical protein P873_13515 [Arenimonas composti TR7-09 = DSM 18010]
MSRTSDSHPLRIAEVKAGAGLVGVSFCPGKVQPDGASGPWARDLATDFAAIRDWGAAQVLTLIEDHEFVALRVQRLGEEVDAAGMRWFPLPITDQSTPDHRFLSRWPAVAREVVPGLRDGGRVFVHCKGGLGRAGTVAAWLARHLEPALAAGAAIARVRAARSRFAVETPAQAAWVGEVAPVWPAKDAGAKARGCESCYRATTYRVNTTPTIDLRIGVHSQALRDLHARRGVDSSVFITAWNPFGDDRPLEWNARALDHLRRHLRGSGLGFEEGAGVPDGSGRVPEQSLLVPGPDRAAAANLCAAFAQNAVVYCGPDAVPELLWNPLFAVADARG